MGNNSGKNPISNSFDNLQINTDQILDNYNQKKFKEIHEEWGDNLKDYERWDYERDMISGKIPTPDEIDKKMDKTMDKLKRLEKSIQLDIKIETGTEYPVYSDIDLYHDVVKQTSSNTGQPGFLIKYYNGEMTIEKTYFN